MDPSHPSGRRTPQSLRYLALSTAFILAGCASPGPPRAPSLHLPQPVQNLTATRTFNTVYLHFTLPSQSTDKLPLRGSTVTGELCRQLPHNACVTVDSSKQTVAISSPNPTTWTDVLPPELTQDPPQLLTYRIEFFSPTGRSAGFSQPAYTASGPSPAPVENFSAEGTSLGILLSWNDLDSQGEVLLHREAPLQPHPQRTKSVNKPHNATNSPFHSSTPTDLWLNTNNPSGPPTNRSLDTNILPNIPYSYTAQRRLRIQIGSHAIELRSAPSVPVDLTLLQIYPPPAPAGLTAIGYVSGEPPVLAVDLIWQPANDTGLITPLAGYNVYRQPIDVNKQSTSPRVRLNTDPIPSPAFHDVSASPSIRYRYSVSAVDIKGNESSTITTLLRPTAAN